jgi:ubiquinone/menaquinone biosynthesis C-methylase UbiE
MNKESGPTRFLDVAGGTGDISFRICDALRSSSSNGGNDCEVIISDINPSMLDVGRARAKKLGIGTRGALCPPPSYACCHTSTATMLLYIHD